MFAIELLGKKSNGGSGKDAGEAIGKKWGGRRSWGQRKNTDIN
jgi:hypothetical protein